MEGDKGGGIRGKGYGEVERELGERGREMVWDQIEVVLPERIHHT